METYKIIKKFLTEGGKCILIENDKPVGVVLSIEEYELLQSKSQIPNPKSQTNPEAEKSLFSEAKNESAETVASADIADIEAAADVTLEDLGLDELPY